MLPFSLRSYRRLRAEAEAVAEPVIRHPGQDAADATAP
jgi:hypothetical protein